MSSGKLVLDTNVFVHLIRGDSKGKKIKDFLTAKSKTELYISIVTRAELKVLVKVLGWGNTKIQLLNEAIKNVITIPILNSDKALIDAYVNIDLYSRRKQGNINDDILPGSAIEMAKNDLWIAATTYRIGATLVTADKDFNHLDGIFFDVVLFEE